MAALTDGVLPIVPVPHGQERGGPATSPSSSSSSSKARASCFPSLQAADGCGSLPASSGAQLLALRGRVSPGAARTSAAGDPAPRPLPQRPLRRGPGPPAPLQVPGAPSRPRSQPHNPTQTSAPTPPLPLRKKCVQTGCWLCLPWAVVSRTTSCSVVAKESSPRSHSPSVLDFRPDSTFYHSGRITWEKYFTFLCLSFLILQTVVIILTS